LSEPIAERLEPEDIQTILLLEWEYLGSIEASEKEENKNSVPIDVDEDDLLYYVIFNAVKHNIYLSYGELDEIISLEFDYMEEYGLLEVKKLGAV
jgi:hypothetical protein